MDEVFGEENFVTTIVWQKVDGPKNTARHFSEDHEFLLVYARDAERWRPRLLPRSEEMLARYKNPDKDPRGPWLLSDVAARNYYAQGRYSITTPSGQTITGPPAGSYWRVSKERFKELENDNRIWWGRQGNNRPPSGRARARSDRSTALSRSVTPDRVDGGGVGVRPARELVEVAADACDLAAALPLDGEGRRGPGLRPRHRLPQQRGGRHASRRLLLPGGVPPA